MIEEDVPEEEDFVFVLTEKSFDNFIENSQFTVGELIFVSFKLSSTINLILFKIDSFLLCAMVRTLYQYEAVLSRGSQAPSRTRALQN
jgi:hypothetical protein